MAELLLWWCSLLHSNFSRATPRAAVLHPVQLLWSNAAAGLWRCYCAAATMSSRTKENADTSAPSCSASLHPKASLCSMSDSLSTRVMRTRGGSASMLNIHLQEQQHQHQVGGSSTAMG